MNTYGPLSLRSWPELWPVSNYNVNPNAGKTFAALPTLSVSLSPTGGAGRGLPSFLTALEGYEVVHEDRALRRQSE